MNKTDPKAIKSLMRALRPGISYCHPRDFIADSFTLHYITADFLSIETNCPNCNFRQRYAFL